MLSATFGSVRSCWRHSEWALSVIADQKDTVGTDTEVLCSSPSFGWDKYERDSIVLRAAQRFLNKNIDPFCLIV